MFSNCLLTICSFSNTMSKKGDKIFYNVYKSMQCMDFLSQFLHLNEVHFYIKKLRFQSHAWKKTNFLHVSLFVQMVFIDVLVSRMTVISELFADAEMDLSSFLLSSQYLAWKTHLCIGFLD